MVHDMRKMNSSTVARFNSTTTQTLLMIPHSIQNKHIKSLSSLQAPPCPKNITIKIRIRIRIRITREKKKKRERERRIEGKGERRKGRKWLAPQGKEMGKQKEKTNMVHDRRKMNSSMVAIFNSTTTQMLLMAPHSIQNKNIMSFQALSRRSIKNRKEKNRIERKE